VPGAASAGPQNPAGEEHVGEGVVSAEETCGGEEEAAAEVEEAEKHEAEDEDEDKVVALAGLAQLPRLSRLELSDWPLLDYDDLEVHCNPPPPFAPPAPTAHPPVRPILHSRSEALLTCMSMGLQQLVLNARALTHFTLSLPPKVRRKGETTALRKRVHQH
jgi:hypothetical protein